MSAAAGWYADPTDDAAVRWWDGQRWTGTTRPAPRELVGATQGSGASVSSVGSPSLPPSPAPTPTPSPSPTPTPTPVTSAPVTAAPVTAAPVAAAEAPVAVPRKAHSHAAPAAAAALAPRPNVIEPEALADADRSRPGSGPAPAALRPEPTTPLDFMSAMSAPGTDTATARPAATSQFGSPLGVGGAAPRPSAPSRPDAAGLASTPYAPPRHWVRTIVILVLVLALAALAAILVVPRVLDRRAASAAAEEPALVPSHAPAAFAGVRRASLPVTALGSLSTRLTSGGAPWTWTQGYRNRAAGTLVLGAELGASDRATAYRALSDHNRGQEFVDALVSDVATGSGTRDVAGDPVQYASPVGGSLWCLPYASSGIAGGLCVWTNGRQLLVTETLPGVQESAAKSLLAELAALGTAASKTASTAPRA